MFHYLNSNIEIHKLKYFDTKKQKEENLNSNIEIHKFDKEAVDEKGNPVI